MNYNLSNPMSSFFNTASNLQSLKSNSMNLQQQQNEMEAAKVQAEQQALTQKRVSEIMPLVKSGDYDATIELATLDPNMSDAINKAKANLSEGQDREMINWLTQYQSAPDKAAFLQQDNPNLTVDDNFRGMSEEQRDVMARIVGAQLMPKDMFNVTFGKEAPNYSNVQFDEAGSPYGLNKETGQYEPIQGGFQRAKPTPQTVVNMGTQGLTEEQKALAKQRVNRYGKITDDADAASQEIDSINQIRAIDLDTGFGTEVKSTAAKVINALGGKGDDLLNVNVSDVEKFNAVAEKQVLNVMSSQKGPQTDQDAIRIKKTVAGTENTKEANAFILDSMEAIANRKIEQQAFWDSYLDSNDGTLKGVQAAWAKYKKETPMVSEVVKNPQTGKPMFFYQFREAFPGRDEAEVIQAWRKLTGGK